MDRFHLAEFHSYLNLDVLVDRTGVEPARRCLVANQVLTIEPPAHMRFILRGNLLTLVRYAHFQEFSQTTQRLIQLSCCSCGYDAF